MEELMVNEKRVRDDSDEPESDIDSPEVKRIRENLLNSVDDDTELCKQELDSFMKSFEEEIKPSTVTSESGESRPDLGYLLKASDDELGLPPTNELGRVQSDSVELGGEFWEIPSYDSFGFGEMEDFGSGDGLFEYSDFGFGSGDLAWRPETLPAQ